jgi:hypothetical protein
MEGSTTTNTGYKRIESLLARANALASRAMAALSALTNTAQSMNAAAIPPALTVAYTQSFTPRSTGRVRVFGTIYVQTDAVDLPILFFLERDGLQIGPAVNQDSGHVSKDGTVSLEWVDTTTLAAHVYGITATVGAGHTVTVLAANEAELSIQEQP